MPAENNMVIPGRQLGSGTRLDYSKVTSGSGGLGVGRGVTEGVEESG